MADTYLTQPSSLDVRRIKRQAKAMAVIHGLVRKPIDPVPAPVALPDQTYTFWGDPSQPLPDVIVYFMYSAGRIKIGLSAGLRDRQYALKMAGAFPPVILMVFEGRAEMEREFHRRFAKDRLHGEWFDLSPSIRAFLNVRFCEKGRASFKRAESQFLRYCTKQLKETRK